MNSVNSCRRETHQKFIEWCWKRQKFIILILISRSHFSSEISQHSVARWAIRSNDFNSRSKIMETTFNLLTWSDVAHSSARSSSTHFVVKIYTCLPESRYTGTIPKFKNTDWCTSNTIWYRLMVTTEQFRRFSWQKAPSTPIEYIWIKTSTNHRFTFWLNTESNVQYTPRGATRTSANNVNM